MKKYILKLSVFLVFLCQVQQIFCSNDEIFEEKTVIDSFQVLQKKLEKCKIVPEKEIELKEFEIEMKNKFPNEYAEDYKKKWNQPHQKYDVLEKYINLNPILKGHLIFSFETILSIFSAYKPKVEKKEIGESYFDEMHDDQWLYSDGIRKKVQDRCGKDYKGGGINKKIELIAKNNWFLTKLKADKDETTPLYEQFMMVTPETKIVVLGGDLHGDIHSLVTMIKPYINDDYTVKKEYKNYLFVGIGDYVDGFYSIEVLTLLKLLKLKNRKNFITIRGNHETINMNENDFRIEVDMKYDNKFNKLKDYLKYVYAAMPTKLWLGYTQKSVMRFVPFLRHLKKYETKKTNWYCFLHATLGENENVLNAFNDVSNKNEIMQSFYKVVGDENNMIEELNADPENNVLKSSWGYIDQFLQSENKNDVGYNTIQQEIIKITDEKNEISGVFSGHQHCDQMSLKRPRDLAFIKQGFYNFWNRFYILSPTKTIDPIEDNGEFYYSVNPEDYNILKISPSMQQINPIPVEYDDSYKERYEKSIKEIIIAKVNLVGIKNKEENSNNAEIKYIHDNYIPEEYITFQKNENNEYITITNAEFEKNRNRDVYEKNYIQKVLKFTPDVLGVGSVLLLMLAYKYGYISKNFLEIYYRKYTNSLFNLSRTN